MTIKELIETLQDMAQWEENFEDFKVFMVGHDALGERHYGIELKDLTVNYEDGTVRLWDR